MKRSVLILSFLCIAIIGLNSCEVEGTAYPDTYYYGYYGYPHYWWGGGYYPRYYGGHYYRGGYRGGRDVYRSAPATTRPTWHSGGVGGGSQTGARPTWHGGGVRSGGFHGGRR